MKGVFFSEGLHLDDAEKLGIEKKVIAQVKSLSNICEILQINVPLDENDKIDRVKFLLPFIKSNRERNREVLWDSISGEIKFLYIRKPSLTIEFYKLLKKIKKTRKDLIIIMEIPTFPFHREYQGLAKLMVLKSISCEKKLKDVVDYIVTYSNDDMIWGIPCLKTSNCVNYSEIMPRSECYETVEKTLRLTCVANYTYWHGVDRLIKGVLKYQGEWKIVLNIVGGGKELENLKRLANNSDRVIFYGSKSGKELQSIFDKTDIAVDALGRHRSGVYYNSSLKGKEYVARGVPVISAVKTELDYFDGFKYYLSLPADETDIDIENIIRFYESIYLDSDPNMITKNIRMITEKKFDYKYGFEDVIRTALDRGKMS